MDRGVASGVPLLRPRNSGAPSAIRAPRPESTAALLRALPRCCHPESTHNPPRMLGWLCLHSSKRHLPHRPPVAAAGRRLPTRMALSLTEMEAAAFGALEKEARLDEKLGAGVGANKERAAIQTAVEAYEGALAANEAAALAGEAAEAAGEDDVPPSERTLYHVATDHIAVFGGDPARRKDKVSQRMPPIILWPSYTRSILGLSLLPR